MKYFNLFIALGIIFSSVAQTAQTPINASVIYEVNVRQFSKDGTFAEVQKALPRLKEMGGGRFMVNADKPNRS